MKRFRLATIGVFMVISISAVFAQKDSSEVTQEEIRIKDITDNPGKYENELVEIEGVVTQYVEGTTETTSYFFIQGNYGALLKVNTSFDSPVPLNRYRITGTLVIDPGDRRPVLIEKERTDLSGGETSTMSKTLIFALIGAAAALLIFIIVFVVRTQNGPGKRSETSTTPIRPIAQPVSDMTTTSEMAEDYATIKISGGAPPTMVLVPGRLEIIAGSDKGKSFKIAGYPGLEGSVVTIGRESVEGERKFAHIQLMEKTVSRKQAEIIHTNKMLFVKNLSNTNQTEIDGKAISSGEQIELNPNSVIKTGEVEFKYIQ